VEVKYDQQGNPHYARAFNTQVSGLSRRVQDLDIHILMCITGM
jgi:hypothetical protein